MSEPTIREQLQMRVNVMLIRAVKRQGDFIQATTFAKNNGQEVALNCIGLCGLLGQLSAQGYRVVVLAPPAAIDPKTKEEDVITVGPDTPTDAVEGLVNA